MSASSQALVETLNSGKYIKSKLEQIDYNKIFTYIAGKISIPPRKSSQEALADFKLHYPAQEQWRLLVDGIQYANLVNTDWLIDDTIKSKSHAWVNYESREPGCITGFFLAWYYCMQEIETHPEYTEITVGFIKNLHRLINVDVQNEDLTYQDNLPGEFRTVDDENFCFNILSTCNHRYTQEGLDDLVNAIHENVLPNAQFPKVNIRGLTQLPEGTIRIIKYHPPRPHSKPVERSSSSSSLLRAFFEDQVQKILSNYNKNITLAIADDDKLKIIGQTVEALERTHPFVDTNGRVFVNLLLNYLLIKEGFPPVTLIEPNVFDAFANHVDVLKNGIANTLDIYNGNKNLFGFTISDPELISKMDGMMDKARQKLDDMIKEKIKLPTYEEPLISRPTKSALQLNSMFICPTPSDETEITVIPGTSIGYSLNNED